VSPNTTFSIALFSSNTGDAESESTFWQYHYGSPALRQTSESPPNVTQDSIYRIGGLTEVFTVWSLLLTAGDQILNDPVTKHLPELSNYTEVQNTVSNVKWDDVTVGQLASHMSGVARDCELAMSRKMITEIGLLIVSTQIALATYLLKLGCHPFLPTNCLVAKISPSAVSAVGLSADIYKIAAKTFLRVY
jgi:hypothetical protein